MNYVFSDGDVYCTAGFGKGSDWYRNLLVNPRVEVWLPGSRWVGLADEFSQTENRLEILRAVIRASGLAAPMMGLDSRKLSETEFDQATQNYRLIRIRCIERLSGPGGPGDLAWVWIPAFLAGLACFFILRRKK